jgi:hypothetical protein
MEEGVHFLCFDNDVVDIDLDVSANPTLQASLHATLIGGSCVLQPEGHGRVAVYAMWCDEGCAFLVFLLEPNLMVPRVAVEKGEAFAACGGFDDLINPGKREVILWAVLVELREVDAYLERFDALFSTITGGDSQSASLISLMNLASRSRVISSPVCSHLGPVYRRTDCSNRLGVGEYLQLVLSEFPGDSWHIYRVPGECPLALAEELDKRTFLCRVEGVGHPSCFGGVRRVNLHCLCILLASKVSAGTFGQTSECSSMSVVSLIH